MKRTTGARLVEERDITARLLLGDGAMNAFADDAARRIASWSLISYSDRMQTDQKVLFEDIVTCIVADRVEGDCA